MILALAAAGLLGAILRFGLSRLVAQLWSTPFPAGTLAVNWLGSLLTGLLAGAIGRALPGAWRPLLLTGLLGAFTTFSTFTYETVQLWDAGDRRLAIRNVLLSVVGGAVLALVGALLP